MELSGLCSFKQHSYLEGLLVATVGWDEGTFVGSSEGRCVGSGVLGLCVGTLVGLSVAEVGGGCESKGSGGGGERQLNLCDRST
jgi:hypothetical protein